MKIITYLPGLIGFLFGEPEKSVEVPENDIESVAYPMGDTY